MMVYNIENLKAIITNNAIFNLSLPDVPDQHSEKMSFFDFAQKDGGQIITDYSQLDREIIIKDDGIGLGDNKYKVKIGSISDLRKKLEDIVKETTKIVHSHAGVKLSVTVNTYDIESLTSQLVYDILFDKYASESTVVDLQHYCKYTAPRFVGRYDHEHVYQIMVSAIELEFRIKHGTNIIQDLEVFGIDPDGFARQFILHDPFSPSIKRSKIFWDILYYNNDSSLITYRQYSRKLKRDWHGNYTTRHFIDDLKRYEEHLAALLPNNKTTGKSYFNQTMEYYLQEFYRRFNFMYKLAVNMKNVGVHYIDKEHALVKRFYCPVLFLINQDDLLSYRIKHKPYRPLLMIEDDLQIDILASENENECGRFSFNLTELQILRAKAYEVFRYNFEFASDDYSDMNDFIYKDYNAAKYHEPNKVWDEWQSPNDIKDHEKRKKCVDLTNKSKHC